MKTQQKCENGLRKEIADLPYSHSEDLSDEVRAPTQAGLEKLWAKYGYAEVLGELYHQWPLEKALSFFEKMQFDAPKPKTIRTIGTYYHRGYNGGVERAQAQLITLWVSMGYRVVFFSAEPNNPLDYPYPNSVKRIQIPGGAALAERLSAIEKAVREEKVDVFVNHAWSTGTVLWETVLLKMQGIAYVNYIHAHFSLITRDGRFGLIRLRTFKMCDAIITLSETNARFYQLCGCNTYLVENPITEDLRKITEPAPLKSRHVLMVGRIAPEKYPMEAVQIFKLVHDACPDAVFDIVGADGENLVNLMAKYCAENSLSDAVIFHGLKSSQEVNRFFHDSACMLFTSKLEGYPMVLLEAKAHGLPIAMYDLPFLTMVKDKKGILTAPIGNIRGVADNIIRLLRDDELRQNYGRDAREDFELHSAYDLAGAWEDIFTLAGHSGAVTSKAYYNPEEVPVADRFIEPALLEAVSKMFDDICCDLYGSIDCRVGRAVLKLPRAVKKLLSKLKGMLIDS